MQTTEKQRKGLACLSPERKREIASLGGRASQARGTAHHWTVEEATEAAKKGLLTRRKRKRQAV